MDTGLVLLSVVGVVGALSAIIAWTLGFIRAGRERALLDRLLPYTRPAEGAAPKICERQVISDRLHAYCQRSA